MIVDCIGMGRVAALALAAAPSLVSAQTYGPDAEPKAPAAAQLGAFPPGIEAELAAAAARAVNAAPTVQSARLGNQAATTDVRSAKWIRGPSVSVDAFAYEGGSQFVRGDHFTPNLTVDQPIWQGGRTGGTIDRARASERQSEAVIDESAQDIALRVTNAYFDYVRAMRRSAVLERGLDEHRALVGSIERRVAQEVSPRVDLELARSRTAQLEEQRTTAAAQAETSLQVLRVLVADPAFTPAAAPTYDARLHHPGLAAALEQATTCSPTRRRLQAEALVARADQRLAKAAVLPRLSAQFTSNEVTGERVGLAFRAAINGGLSQFEAARAAELRRDAAEARIGAADQDVQTALSADFAENGAARSRIESGGLAAQAARAVTDSYQRLFVVGRRSWLDVMNAALETTQADLAADDAAVSAMASAARIQLRTCRWQPEPPVSRP